MFATGIYRYLYLGVLFSLCPSYEQCQGPIEILFLRFEEVLLLEFLSFICWTKLMDFRDRRGAGLVYMLDMVFTQVKRMLRLRISVGLRTTFSFNVAFRTRSCHVLFIFLCAVKSSNNDKPVLHSRKEQQPKSCPTHLHPLNVF